MRFLQELISSIKAGWHAGRGHKATRQGELEKALRHYELAVEYEKRSEKDGSGLSPVTLECLARAHARLGNYKEATTLAEQCRELYMQQYPGTKLVSDCLARIEHFIALLHAGNTNAINKFIAIAR
ncbi:MAG: tetratricopeptide repeat protein [Nitrospirota bacterium]|nr:tetratricopeptide repeat protein [Nitrospirota bacterium]